ncbi:MAG: transglutaminase domain-containing protein [Lachnospiraceae bacterium]|nr:transglutaminase domain-containing protein [Lachnospiraceae bacterium]
MSILLYELIYVLSVAVGIISLSYGYIGFDRMGIILVISQMLLAGLFVVFKKSRWNVRLVMIGVVIMLVAAGVLVSQNEIIYEFIMRNLYLLWLLATGALSFVIGELMCYLRPVKFLVSLSSVAWMIICTVLGYRIEKLFVAVSFMLIILIIAEEIQIRWKKTGYTELHGHIVYISPFIIVTMLLVFISPAPKQAYDWDFVKNIVHVAKETIEDWNIEFSMRGMGDISQTPIGFSDRGSVGEGIFAEDREVMIVSGLTPSISQVRLSGKTFSDFDGHEWIDNDDSQLNDVMIDSILLWASVNDHTDITKDYVFRGNVRVEYRRMKTDHVFIPPKAVPYSNDLNTDSYFNVGGDILWPERRSLNSTYSVSYFRLNTGNDIFTEFLESAGIPDRSSYEKAMSQLNIEDLEGCDYDDYLTHAAHIRETYLNAPVLSPDLREYMDNVYEGATTDAQKMERLKMMLREFDYTETPGRLPESVMSAGDYLDHFVLGTRRGYCSHFATAFVLLARAEGIPARYVQGYIVSNNREKDITVNESMAHAWPEVYYENAGWIPYEPTPIYVSRSYWKTSAEYAMEQSDVKAAAEPKPEEPETELSEEPEEDDGIRISIRWYMIVIPVLLGLVFIILFLAAGHLIIAIRFKRMKPEDKFVLLCRQIFRILRLSGEGIGENETLLEYRNRLDAKTETGFLTSYEKYLYKGELEEGALDKTVSTKSDLLRLLRKNRPVGFLRYFCQL